MTSRTPGGTEHMLTRRLFLRYLLGLPFLSSFPLPVQETWADSPVLPSQGGKSIGEFFKGEELHYEIGVWLFKKVALGKLSFKAMEEKGRYLATLQGGDLRRLRMGGSLSGGHLSLRHGRSRWRETASVHIV